MLTTGTEKCLRCNDIVLALAIRGLSSRHAGKTGGLNCLTQLAGQTYDVGSLAR